MTTCQCQIAINSSASAPPGPGPRRLRGKQYIQRPTDRQSHTHTQTRPPPPPKKKSRAKSGVNLERDLTCGGEAAGRSTRKIPSSHGSHTEAHQSLRTCLGCQLRLFARCPPLARSTHSRQGKKNTGPVKPERSSRPIRENLPLSSFGEGEKKKRGGGTRGEQGTKKKEVITHGEETGCNTSGPVVGKL